MTTVYNPMALPFKLPKQHKATTVIFVTKFLKTVKIER